MANYLTLQEAVAANRCLPFGNSDGEILVSYLRVAKKNGLDVVLLPTIDGGIEGDFGNGLLILGSKALDRTFLFLKIDAGRGLFGGQKFRYQTYLGSPSDDLWTPGPSFGLFITALTSINNVYRSEGLLRGPAL